MSPPVLKVPAGQRIGRFLTADWNIFSSAIKSLTWTQSGWEPTMASKNLPSQNMWPLSYVTSIIGHSGMTPHRRHGRPWSWSGRSSVSQVIRNHKVMVPVLLNMINLGCEDTHTCCKYRGCIRNVMECPIFTLHQPAGSWSKCSMMFGSADSGNISWRQLADMLGPVSNSQHTQRRLHRGLLGSKTWVARPKGSPWG